MANNLKRLFRAPALNPFGASAKKSLPGIFLTFACVGLFFFSFPVWALDNYKEFRRDRWDFEVNSEFFRSEGNYPSSGGGSQSLPNGNHYQLLDVNFATRYMPRQDWSMFAWGTVASAESKDSLATRTNSSLSEVAAGFDFLMYSDTFQLVPEIILLMPLEKVDPKSDTVMNSEGVMEVRSRIVVQKDFATWAGYGWLGFNYRSEGRSFLMPWGFGAQLKLSRVRLGAELFGYQSVTDDTDKNSIIRTAYINSVNAGSLKFYGAEPSLIDTQVYATWLMSRKWSLQANGGATVAGANTASGFHVGGFIRYSFDMTEGYTNEVYTPVDSPVPSYRSNMYESGVSSEKKVPKFREETEDGVDQNLFNPQPVVKPRKQQQDLQQQLDDTEFQIELKSDKKKKRRR